MRDIRQRQPTVRIIRKHSYLIIDIVQGAFIVQVIAGRCNQTKTKKVLKPTGTVALYT